jgi:wyosine [tRNA(Phe)-imidazoG37] synthetase (radical SAM superfamily)
MPGIQTVSMSLAGDPFASSTCMDFLRQPGTPDVILWTNGILLPRFWQEIKRKVTVVIISIDAAKKETYEQLRQPAKWEQIQQTLDFMRVLVACQEVFLFQINMVVQQANFREIPEFIAMGKRHLAHIIQFCLIAPWPHITKEHWSLVNVANPEHPEHQDFLHVLQDPILHSLGVDAGFINNGSLDFYGHSSAETNFWFDPLK